MPATTDCHSSPISFSHFGRSILSIRRDQVHPMEAAHAHYQAATQDPELEAFQRHVADRFHDLSAVGSDELLSLPWIRKLLDVFLCCQAEFTMILVNKKGNANAAPLASRLVSDFFERSVRALDLCNAIRDGIEQMRLWQKQLEIVLCALENQRSLGPGQFRRAKKALNDLSIGMADEFNVSVVGHRNRSFGRNNAQQKDHKTSTHFRSLSWSVSRSWSAAKQLQAIGANLAVPKTNEITATNGVALAVFTMSSVLLFVMWALVAAIPCQDRGQPQTHFSIPRQLLWAIPVLSLQERVLEESRKKERKYSCGLLKEVHRIEMCARHMMNELTDTVQFPLTVEKEIYVRERVQELSQVFEAVKDGLDPLECQVREVFHRIARSRTEGLESPMERKGKRTE